MPNINKDEKVIKELYEENQRLYTRLGKVYDNELLFLAKIVCNSLDKYTRSDCKDEIKRLQKEINERG